ncbi:arginine--tRNA ligase [Acholeplasma sp. OttesenSCG-928-E16]|nr:arginine--tRNA ligase [Acholeplasma sp. OttesenSCG-928-E16]
MLNSLKDDIKLIIKDKLGIGNVIVEEPKKGDSDLSIPLFSLSKEMNKPLNDIYSLLKDVILENIKIVERIEFLSGFLNIYLDRVVFSRLVLDEIRNKGLDYATKQNNNKTVVIDYSSPNIAKSFSVGHLRSTMIGNSIKRIYEKEGYDVVGINHLGDWGTQFGKMIVAYQRWGDIETIKKDPTVELQKLYVKFHEEALIDPSLEDEARMAFKKLENNDEVERKLWEWIREVSIADLDIMYERLGVVFESNVGEAFFNDKMDAVIDELDSKGLLKIDQGATIVELIGMPPALIKKSDGTSLYFTRDLAALLYRYQTYHFSKIIYVVGNEQKLHFEQLKAVTKLMGYDFDIEHVNFGLVLSNGKKMSTRTGNNAKLSNVIDQAVTLAYEAIVEKNPNLENKKEVAEAVGIGAIIFNDLKNERHLDYDFNIENMLRFEGQTGPYLQYSAVRINSILESEEVDINNLDDSCFKLDHYFEIVKILSQLSSVIDRAMNTNSPSVIARYLLLLSQAFNHFYGKEKIIVEDIKIKNTNLLLISCVRTVIRSGLSLLGIKPLNKM